VLGLNRLVTRRYRFAVGLQAAMFLASMFGPVPAQAASSTPIPARSSTVSSAARETPPTIANDASSGPAPWPMLGHDPQHSGRSPFAGPTTPTLKWVFDPPVGSTAPEIRPPTIGADGSIYATANDGHLFVLDPSNGTEKSSSASSSSPSYSTALGPDGEVYVGTGHGNSDFGPRGVDRIGVAGDSWRFSVLGYANGSTPTFADNTVYLGDPYFRSVYALNAADGSVKWTAAVEGMVQFWSAPAVASAGTVFITTDVFSHFGPDTGNVYALDPVDGSVLWRTPIDAGLNTSPVVGLDGTVYAGASDGYVYALDGVSGVLLWRHQMDGTIGGNPAISADGAVIATSEAGDVVALDADTGAQLWRYEAGGLISSAPAIDSNGVVYVGISTNSPNDGDVVALRGSDGALLWRFSVGSPVTDSSVAIGSDGTLYVGGGGTASTGQYALVAIGDLTVQQSQMITFDPLPDVTFGASPITLAAAASSGLAVSYAASGACSVAGSTLTFSGPGTCTVTASQAGDASWAAAPDVTRSFTVHGAVAPTILFHDSFTGPAGQTLEAHNSAYAKYPSGDYLYLTGNGAVSTPSYGLEHYNGPYSSTQGVQFEFTTMFQPSLDQQWGVEVYAHSPGDRSEDAYLGIGPAGGGTIYDIYGTVFHEFPSGYFQDNTTYTFFASYDGSEVVVYLNGVEVARFNGNHTGYASGSIGVQLRNNACLGNLYYTDGLTPLSTGAPSHLDCSESSAAAQTITFDPLPDVTYGVGPITLAATASSGLSVSFAASGACAVAGPTLTVAGAGPCTVTASQTGDATWEAAPDVNRSFTVAPAAITVTAVDATMTYGGTVPSLLATYVGFVNGDTASDISGTPDLATTATSLSPVGSYPITIGPGTLAAANYVFVLVPGTMTVVAPPSPPSSVLAAAAGSSVVISWAVPTSDGGSPITGYTATVMPGGMTCSTSGALTCTIEGLDDGTYSATAIATNAAGSSSASDPPTVFRIRTRNQVPTATLELSQATGVAPLDTTATVSATDADNDPLTYTLDFGDGTEVASGALPVAPVAHRYASSGVWTVRLAVSDGLETTIETSTVSVGSSEPLRAVAGDDITATVGAAISFDGSASRPLVGIDSYSWTFGDGSPAQPGAIVSHTFTQAGTWTVTLTVGQGTSTDSTTLTATVIPVLGAPSLAITVTETGGATIPGADVVVIDASGTRYAATTDNAGVAHLDGLADGSYTAYGWHDGYQPGTAPVAVSGGTGQANLVLPAGAVAQTSVVATPLTATQAQAAGIDTSDPGNQNVFHFEIHLAVTSDASQQVAFTGYTT